MGRLFTEFTEATRIRHIGGLSKHRQKRKAL